MAKAKFKMGEEVKDKITGFKGIVVARTEHMTGCDRYYVQPIIEEGKENKMPEGTWLDEGVIEKVAKRKITKKEVQAKKRGAYAPAPF